MANPRQRRKARSSSYRPISHSKHAKRKLKKAPPIRGPKVLQDAWDKRKTVKQNYAALGLSHTLDPLASGGTEMPVGHISGNDSQLVEPSHESASSGTSQIPQGFGRIFRDEAGKVVRIELKEEKSSSEEDDEMDMKQLEPVVEPEIFSKWVAGGDVSRQSIQVQERGVVTALDQVSAPQTASHTLSFAISGVGARHASAGEIGYLQKLVNKHGDDVEKMAMDRKLNPEQRTAGELQRALRRAGFGYSG